MSLKGRSCWDVNIRMDDAEKLSLEAMGQFVEASEELRFEAQDRQQLYDWGEQVLVGQQYAQLGKAARGLLLQPMLRQFPFRILGFHTDNGSEFINAPSLGCRKNCASSRPKAGLGKAVATAWWRPKTERSSVNISAWIHRRQARRPERTKLSSPILCFLQAHL
jgi:hypothetical protein